MIGLTEAIKLIDRAIQRENDTNIDWVFQQIEEGGLQLWRGERSAVVTRCVDVGNGGHLVWVFAGGDLEEIRDEMKPHIEEWAKHLGCVKATMTARPGWQKVLPDYKKRKQVVLVKEL